jgi:hypothetical protein
MHWQPTGKNQVEPGRTNEPRRTNEPTSNKEEATKANKTNESYPAPFCWRKKKRRPRAALHSQSHETFGPKRSLRYLRRTGALHMSKAGAFLILTGAGCLALALATRWDGLFDPRLPFSPQLDILASRDPGDARLGMAPEGWRAFRPSAARVAAPPPSERTASPLFTRASRNGEPPADAPGLAPPRDRASLVRELQRGLKRVGCYDGEVSGVWTQRSRSAMRAFTGRINAALPVDEPDGVLLALLQGHKDKACGMPCPPGEGLAADGRCLPNAVLAHAGRPTAPPPAAIERSQPSTTATSTGGWASTTTVAPPEPMPPPEGRMSLAGPTSPGTVTRPTSVDAYAPARPTDVSSHARFGASFFKQLDRWGNR